MFFSPVLVRNTLSVTIYWRIDGKTRYFNSGTNSLCLYIYICVYIYVYVYVCVYVCMYIYIYIIHVSGCLIIDRKLASICFRLCLEVRWIFRPFSFFQGETTLRALVWFEL